MPRVEVISSDEEESIWQHKSQAKRRKMSQSSHSSTSTKVGTKVNKKERDRTINPKNTFYSQGIKTLLTNSASSVVKEEGPTTSTDFKPTKVYSQIIQNVSVMKRRESSCTQVKDEPDVVIPHKQRRKSKSRSTKRKSIDKKAVPATPDDKKWSGRCRNCQFPFSALSKIDTPSWHLKDCLDVSYNSTDQCRSGINCTSTIASHYKKYRHTALSRSEHKKENARPPTSTGDVENAKVKLEFNDKHNMPHTQPAALNDIINLDSDSPTHSDTGGSLSQTEEMAIMRERSDKLKRRSVLTLMKQSVHKLKRPPSSQSCMEKEESEALSDKPTSKLDIDNDTLKSNKLTSTPFSEKLDEDLKKKMDDLLHHSPNCDEDKDIKVFRQRELDSEEIITKVNPIDLIDSESSNSVQDINSIADNSRSIPDMLQDVFGESQNDKEHSGDMSESDIVEESDDGEYRQRSDCTYVQSDLSLYQPNESDSAEDSQSETDGDSDIIQTGLTSISRFKNKVKYNKDDISNVRSMNNLNKDSPITRKDMDMEININNPPNVMESVGETVFSTDKNYSKQAVQQFSDESNSCSRDSAKGFFARKLEEKKLIDPQRIFSELKCSKNAFDKFEKKENTECECEKSNLEDNQIQKELQKQCFDEEFHTTEKISPKGEKGEKISKAAKSSTSVQKCLKKKGKTVKNRKSLKQNAHTKSAIKKEIRLMELDGLGKITVESASSEEEDSHESSEKAAEPKCDPVDQTDQKLSKTMTGNYVDRNGQNKLGYNSKTKSSASNHHLSQSSRSDSKYRASGIEPFIQESPKDMNLTPKFQINNVRSTRDDTDLPGGFFIDDNDEPEDGHETDNNDGCGMKANLSEGEEEDDDNVVNDNDIVDDYNDDAVNDHQDYAVNDHYDDVNFTKVKNSNLENMKQTPSSNDQKVPNFNDINLPTVDSYSDYEDTQKVLDNIATKVQEIQKNALDILMQTSKALHHRNKSKLANRKDSTASHTKPGRNVNEFLMSNRGKDTQAVTKPDMKSKPQPQLNTKEPKNEAGTSNNNNTRKCPFYKKIPGTSFTVDAFRYGSIPECTVYFLTHFHYDHYGGLNKKFAHPIYCSKITGNLVIKKVGVQAKYIHTVPLNTPTVVEDVEIVMLEANHCPGAVLILFKLRSGQVFLHTGDFRACRDMESYPSLQNLRIHSLYLDTTYCDPQYDFPPQKDVVKFAVNVAKDAVSSNPSTLIVCGSYTIGKERIFRGIAEELGCKISVTRDKKSVLDCLEDEWLLSRVTLKWEESRLHVLPMAKLNYVGLKEHLQKNGNKYNTVLGIKPTGWTYNKKLIGLDHIKPEVNKDNIKVYGLPYSEHSSFLELKQFVQFTKPDKILPTVNNGNYHSRKKMEAIFAAWMEDARQKPARSSVQPSLSKWAK